MKKLSIKLDATLEVPDDWEIEAPNDEIQEHVKAGGQYFYPDITWMVLLDSTYECTRWKEGDDDFLNDMLDRILDLNLNYSLELMAGDEGEEGSEG